MLKVNIFYFFIFTLIITACQTSKSGIRCHKFAVLPPADESAEISEKILKKWKSLAVKHLPKCYKFVNQEKSDNIFEFLEIRPLSPPQLSELSEGQKNSISRFTGATHVIKLDLKHDKKKNHLVITPKLMSLSSGKVLKAKFFRNSYTLKASDQFFTTHKSYQYANKALSLFPNAVTIGFKDYKMINYRYEDEKLWDEEEITPNSETPKIIGSIGILKIQHPYLYKQVDFDFDMFFGVVFYNVDSKYSYYNLGTNDERLLDSEYEISLIGGGPTFNFNVSLYLFSVRTFLQFGYGYGIAKVKDSYDLDKVATGPIISVDMGLEYFVTQNFFLRYAIGGTEFIPGLIDNEVFKSGQDEYFFLGIGYYIGSWNI